MATVIEPEGDPTFLAYERARQYGEQTLQREAQRDTSRVQEDTTRAQTALGFEQDEAVDSNLADYRSSGFGLSGNRAKAEDRIRQDIALRVGQLLTGLQRATTDIDTDLADALARSQFEREEQMLAARNRLTRANAQSGVGI